MNRKIKKNPLIFLSVIVLCLTGCNKLGINQSLPGIDRIIVEDNQNTNNKVGSIVVKNTSGTVIPNYFLWFKQNPSISTPSNVKDTMFVCVAPNTDISNLRIILTMADKSMSATVTDTNKIRVFQPLQTPYSETFSGRLRNYTAIDTTGFDVTFSNGYKRHYAILLEVLDYVPPRIYDLGSFSGGLDSVGYDDAEQIITIYRSATNTDMSQTLDYKLEPATATIIPQYLPGSIFNFSSIPQQTIVVPISVPKANGTQFTTNYKIKLNLGYNRLVEVMDGKATLKNYTGGTRDDREFKIAVDENHVYVLVQYLPASLPITNNTILGVFGTDSRYWYQSSYEVYAYTLKGNNGNIPNPIKLSTDNKKVFDIVCFDNVLYGITTDTLANINQKVYGICKWNNITEGATPVNVSQYTTNSYAGALTLFTATKENNNIVFYSTAGNYAANSATGMQIARISSPIDGNGTQPAIGVFNPGIFWKNSMSTSSPVYTTFYNLKEEGISIISFGNGYLFGTSFDNDKPPGFMQYVSRISDGGNNDPVGMNIVMMGNKYYMIHNLNIKSTGAKNNYMGIFDLGNIDVKTALRGIALPAELLAKRVSKNLMAADFKYQDLASRGNCRTYRLPNGQIRIASLVSIYGFKVWDIK